MVVPLNEHVNTNPTEEGILVTEKPVEELNDAVSLNDDVSIGSSGRKESGVTEEVGDGGVEGSPAVWGYPAAFVKKTYEMVEDPDTDPVVSWSFARDSFVVWEPHVFSNTILPKYFKHSNFSSFIRQLNTYGFRKVYSDRWEFANEGFQGGKKHLLKNIKRRSKCNKQHQAESNSTKPGLEDEVEKLKNDMSLLKLEILKLRHLHENTQIQLTNVEQRVRSAELKQCRMLVFLTRIAKKPSFVEQLMQTVKRKRELDGLDMAKRRRLIETKCPHSPHSFPKARDTIPYVDCRHQGSEQLLDTLQSELTGSLTALLSELTANGSSSRTSVNNVSSSSAYEVVSEKLMGESSVVDEEVEDVHVSNMYLELEDLISKPVGWFGSASGLVGQSSSI